MKRLIFAVTVLTTSSGLLMPPPPPGARKTTAERPSPQPRSSRRRIRSWFEGSPYDRGLTHGTQLKNQIHELVQLWKTDLMKQYKLDPDLFIKRFVATTNYASAIKQWTPDILDEIKGIADGGRDGL